MPNLANLANILSYPPSMEPRVIQKTSSVGADREDSYRVASPSVGLNLTVGDWPAFGAWQTLVNLTFPVYIDTLSIAGSSMTANTTGIVEIAIGDAGAEKTLCRLPWTDLNAGVSYLTPIGLIAGPGRISARASGISSSFFDCVIGGFRADLMPSGLLVGMAGGLAVPGRPSTSNLTANLWQAIFMDEAQSPGGRCPYPYYMLGVSNHRNSAASLGWSYTGAIGTTFQLGRTGMVDGALNNQIIYTNLWPAPVCPANSVPMVNGVNAAVANKYGALIYRADYPIYVS